MVGEFCVQCVYIDEYCWLCGFQYVDEFVYVVWVCDELVLCVDCEVGQEVYCQCEDVIQWDCCDDDFFVWLMCIWYDCCELCDVCDEVVM